MNYRSKSYIYLSLFVEGYRFTDLCKIKASLCLIACWMVCLEAMAQNIPPFKSLRYEEDYAFLQYDSSQTWYKRMKYKTLSEGGKAYVSLGGEARYQYLWYSNEDWGEVPLDSDGFILTRYLGHIDLQIGRQLRAFVQLQSSLVSGRASAISPVEENPLDLHQAFVDLRNATGQLIFRLGRQELQYGSQRLISVRELPNNRQAFDAVKAVLSGRRATFDIFYSHYVRGKKGIFDDGISKAVRLWGVYGVGRKLSLLGNLDLYYLGLWKKRTAFNDGIGEELRHSVGSRIWGGNALWQYDLEGVYQFGMFAGKPIRAWTLSINSSYRLSAVLLQPQIGLKTEFISGDAEWGDDRLQTFNPLFPRGAYFGLAAFIGPANLWDLHPSLSLTLAPQKLVCNLEYDAFWRYSLNDGIYNPAVAPVYPGEGMEGRFIGHQSAIDFTYTPNQYLLLRAEGTRFSAGEFLKQAGPGNDVLFGRFTMQFKF